MPAANITIKGIRELRARLRDTVATTADASDLSVATKSAIAQTASRRLSVLAGLAAQDIRDAARANEASQGWPKAIIGATFKFSDPNSPKPKNRLAALVGIRKVKPLRSIGATVINPQGVGVEWRARYGYTMLSVARRKGGGVKSRGTNEAGKKLAMGLGTIMERGTRGATAFTRKPWPARPAFEMAVKARRQAALDAFADGIAQVIEWVASSKGQA